jgi:hypothetical protein
MRRFIAMAGPTVTVVAAALALAVPAGAGTGASVRLVSGSDVNGQLSGGLEGQMSDTPSSFESFLATYRLTPSGIFTWRMPTVFTGCVGDRCGRLFLDGHLLYRFQPGTRLYDFELGGYQPGTTGDPAAWLGVGVSINRIVGGEGGLAGASGVLVVTQTVFLTESTYRGVVVL